MKVEGVDERILVGGPVEPSFLVFIYEGGDRVSTSPSGERVTCSWSVDSYLFTDGDLPEVLAWLRRNLPTNCCWSLGVVSDPPQPTTESMLEVAWVIGDDVLNLSPDQWSPRERRAAEGMLARRHRVSLV